MDGTLDILSTDHCPYTREQKLSETSYKRTPCGLSGIQTRIPYLFSEGMARSMSLERFVALTSENAAKFYGLYPRKGCLRPGSDADVVLINRDRRCRFGREDFAGAEDYNIFEGWEFRGAVERVFLRGREVFAEGAVRADRGSGRYIGVYRKDGEDMAMTGVMAGWLIVNADKALRDWGFVCENGRIVELAPNSKLAGRPGVADCRDSIVTPTFTNTHTHMYETIAHGAVEPNLSLKPLLEDFWWPVVENRQTLETIRLTAEYAALECLGSGVTLINDILEAPFAERGRRLLTEESVLRRAGMKAILSLESNERIPAGMWDARRRRGFTTSAPPFPRSRPSPATLYFSSALMTLPGCPMWGCMWEIRSCCTAATPFPTQTLIQATGSSIFIVTGVCLKRQKGVNHYGNEQIGAH